MADTTSVDRHIERIEGGRESLHGLEQCVIMYDDLRAKYETALRELKTALDDRMGAYLLAKHDLVNPPALRVSRRELALKP